MASGSTKAVYAAIIANSAVGLAKIVGFVFSGSGAMLSEGIHSIADVSNQLLLAIGISRSQRDASDDHPYGYGRDTFVFAMISAVGIFWFGCGVTLYHGITTLLHPHEVEALPLSLGILVLSGAIESVTLRMAWRAVRDGAKKADMSLGQFMLKGSDPMGVAVLLEDGAAVLGVLLAIIALGLSYVTGDPIYDAIGTLSIGVLLGALAIFLVVKNRTALLGQSISPTRTSQVLEVLQQDPVVEAVYDVKTTVLGSDRSRFKAEVEFDGAEVARRFLASQDLDAMRAEVTDPEALRGLLIRYGDHLIDALGDEIDRIEARIREVDPTLRHVDIEAD